MCVGLAAKFRGTNARINSSIRTHKRKTVAYIIDLGRWLWEPPPRILCLKALGTIGVPIAVLVWWPHEHIIRYAGLVLQLAGIGTVWWGIRETRKLFQHPTFLAQMRQWFERRPRYGGRATVVAVGVAGGTSSAGGVSAWKGAAINATLEQRIEVVENNLLRVRDALSRFQNKTEDDIRRQYTGMIQEKQAREEADQEIRERLNAAHTGGLHISAVGALWLLAGVIMGTIPAELARWFG